MVASQSEREAAWERFSHGPERTRWPVDAFYAGYDAGQAKLEEALRAAALAAHQGDWRHDNPAFERCSFPTCALLTEGGRG